MPSTIGYHPLGKAIISTDPSHYWMMGSADIPGARLRDRGDPHVSVSLDNIGAGHTYLVPGLARGACQRAHRYDGANNVYSHPDILFDGMTDGYAAITIACWIRLPALLSATGTIFSGRRSSANSQVTFAITSDERLVGVIGNGTSAAVTPDDGASLLANVAYYVAMTYDGATIRRYINGTETGTTAAQTGAIDCPPEDVAARNDNGTHDLELACDISDLAIWDRALSAAEMRFLHREGAA